MSQTPPRCLVPDCSKEAASRGLCSAHKGTVSKLLKRKLVTDDALVASVRMLPKGQVRTAAQLWFLEAMTKRSAPSTPTASASRLPQDPSPQEIKERALAIRNGKKP